MPREGEGDKSLSAKDDRKRTVWYVAAETENSEELEKVWEWAKNVKVLLAHDGDEKTVIGLLKENAHKDVKR